MRHRSFRPPQTVREYGYVDGVLATEPRSSSGFLLPWEAIDDQAEAIAEKRAPAFVVVGEFVDDDGTRYPELGVTTGHIEANSHYRRDSKTGRLRWTCPACGLKDGKHERACDWA